MEVVMDKTAKNDKVKKNIKKELTEWIIVVIIGLAVVFVIRNFGFRITAVKGSSMVPNYIHGEYVFTDILSCKLKGPSANDIVICEYNNGVDDENFIKRVIGCPGDEIDIFYDSEEECYKTSVNGKTLEEDYINAPMLSCGDRDYPLTLGEDEYFVMGDNRNVSADSRDSYIGLFDRDSIIGIVRFKIVSKT